MKWNLRFLHTKYTILFYYTFLWTTHISGVKLFGLKLCTKFRVVPHNGLANILSFGNPEATFCMRSIEKWVISTIIEMANDGDPPSSIEKKCCHCATGIYLAIWNCCRCVLMGYRDSLVRETVPLKSVGLINHKHSTSLRLCK